MTRIAFMAYIVGILAGGCVARGWDGAAVAAAMAMGGLLMAARAKEKRLQFYEEGRAN